MFVASVIFSGINWLWLGVGMLGLGIALIAWSYNSGASGIARWVCPVLKLCGLVVLALCLLEPLWSGQHAKQGANLFAVVADNSQGLQVKDPGDRSTRGENLRALLNPQSANWQGTLEENFE